MTLAFALKQKNRLAGELSRKQEILRRENARRSDNVSTVDRKELWDSILNTSNQLADLKGKITVANIGIYPKLERMSELKARIAFIRTIPTTEGQEPSFVGANQEKLIYLWDSFINQQRVDALIVEFQNEMNSLQDACDTYNAITQI